MPNAGVVQVKLLNSEIFTAANDGDTDVTNAFKGVRWIAEPIVWLKAVEDTNGSTLDVSVKYSFDNGTTKLTAVAFTQLSASGNEAKKFTVPPYANKIYVTTAVSAGGGQFTIDLYAGGLAIGSPQGK